MFATARPASDEPARSCTLAYTSTNLRSVSTVQKKCIRGKLKEYRGRSAFTFVPLAAVRSTGTSTSGPTTMALPLGHLRTLIFHRRPCRYGNSPDILGSICRKACSTFPRRVFSRLFAWRSRPHHISQETASGPQGVSRNRVGPTAGQPMCASPRKRKFPEHHRFRKAPGRPTGFRTLQTS